MTTSTPRTMARAMVFALAGMLLVFVLVSLMLASQWRWETTRTIAAAPQRIADLVTDLSTWPRWSGMRGELGPQTAMQVTGEKRVAGQTLTWSGRRGKGIVEVAAVGPASVDYVVKSQAAEGNDPPGVFATGHIEWQPDAAGRACTVTWREEGEGRSFVERWFLWFGVIQDRSRQIQEGSLTGLAQELEQPQPEPAGAK